MAEATTSTNKPKTTKKSGTAKTAGKATAPAAAKAPAATVPPPQTAGAPAGNTAEAKSRFNAALEEAKAGAAALKAEAGERAQAYREQARTRGDDWLTEAKNYGEQAKGKAGDLAVDGKSKIVEALSALAKAVSDTAPTVDEKLGAKYGDYTRSASRSLNEYSAKLDSKSVDELSEDAREMVRKSPGLAVGIAAVGGFLLARMFRGSRD